VAKTGEMGRLRSDLITEMLRDTPVLEWTRNLPEGGGLLRDGREEEARLVALIARTRESLLAIRGSTLEHVMQNWTAAEIRTARALETQ
jgi:hypothetical protein